MPSKVSEKLMQKLAITAPSKLLVEKYLVEIAKCSGIGKFYYNFRLAFLCYRVRARCGCNER